jgi:hypothetical protein
VVALPVPELSAQLQRWYHADVTLEHLYDY